MPGKHADITPVQTDLRLRYVKPEDMAVMATWQSKRQACRPHNGPWRHGTDSQERQCCDNGISPSVEVDIKALVDLFVLADQLL